MRPGSQRIYSTDDGSLPNVAFMTKDGCIAVIVLNDGGSEQTFNVSAAGKAFHSSLASGAVGTYIWKTAM